jgi:hypothetical protein
MSDVLTTTWTDLNDPNRYHRDKQARTEYYFRFIHGWKLIRCGACNGSGYYDNNGSPPCGNCDGTGKERVSPAEHQRQMELEKKWKERDKEIYGEQNPYEE